MICVKCSFAEVAVQSDLLLQFPARRNLQTNVLLNYFPAKQLIFILSVGLVLD